MRWKNRLSFLLAMLTVIASARGGLSRVCAAAEESVGIPLDLIERVNDLAALVFADARPAQLPPAEESIIEALTDFGLGRVSMFAHTDVPSTFHALPAAVLSINIEAAAPPSATPTTVAIPLPPAAIGGAVIAATFLGRPLLGGRRRRPARTFR